MRIERLGRWTIIIVLLATVMAVMGGIISAVIWSPGPEQEDPAPNPCPSPPCFGGPYGPLTLADMPQLVPMALLGAAALLGFLTLLLTLITPRTRNRRGLMLGALAAAGPLVVFIGGEALPHVLSPCVPANLWGAEPPGFCEHAPEGWDLPGRWHLLYHAVIGFLPLSLILAWRGKVSTGRQPTSEHPGS